MRLVLLLPVLLSIAAPAYADGVRESRYSSASPVQTAASAAAARYDGPMLSWASRPAASVATAVAVAVAPKAPVRPTPTAAATWTRYQPVATAPQAATSAQSLSAQSLPAKALPAKPLPASLYAAPVPPAPPPRQVAVNTAPAPAAMPPGATGARFYSVDRDAGLTPDPIPAVGPDNRVLITADAPAPPAEDAAPVHGSADWLAAGVDGDDQASDRRAKTRNQDQ